MPAITVTIGQYGRTKQMTAADLTNRMIPAHRAFYQVGRLATDPPLTDQEVVEKWAEEVMNRMKQRVQDYERQQAAIADVPLT